MNQPMSELSYEDVMQNYLSAYFTVSSSSKFITSLVKDGYDECLKTVPEDEVAKMKGCSGATSDSSTGFIWCSKQSAYFKFYMHQHKSGEFSVIMEKCYLGEFNQ